MKNKSKLDKWFLLSWKKLGLIIISAFASILLHNIIYAIFQNYYSSRGGDEIFFFIIVIFVIPFYFIINVVYTLIKLAKKNKPKKVNKNKK